MARRAARNRMRIAWMYYVEGLTQNEISDKLGLGRITVIRNIQEARRRNEVKIWIEGDDADCIELEFRLQAAFGIDEAIVVPEPSDRANASAAVGSATGAFLSEALTDDMVLGLGWGNTLHAALPTLARSDVRNVQVISLLGGITQAKRQNPTEFAWQVASAVGADCYLLAAPAIVDSPETRRILIERCGLNDIIRRAERMDMAVMSVGALSTESSTFRFGFYSEAERASIIRAGAVGDVLCHFFDRDGKLIDHPLNERVVSVPIDMVRKVPRRVLASGGQEKIEAILGALRLIQPTTSSPRKRQRGNCCSGSARIRPRGPSCRVARAQGAERPPCGRVPGPQSAAPSLQPPSGRCPDDWCGWSSAPDAPGWRPRHHPPR